MSEKHDDWSIMNLLIVIIYKQTDTAPCSSCKAAVHTIKSTLAETV